MKFRPCIDLHGGMVKQIVGSTLADESNQQSLITNFQTTRSAGEFARLYKKDNLTGGHVIMLGPGNEDIAKEALESFPKGMHIGGGINPENAQKFLDWGASHVIVTSYVFKNGIVDWNALKKLVGKIGKKQLVLDLSCKKINNEYYVATDRWQNLTNVKISAETLNKLADFCDEFLIHAAHVEGKQLGFDKDLVLLLKKLSPIKATYAGGIRSLEDLEDLKNAGDGQIDATIGSALDIFGGTLKYTDVVKWNKKQ